MTERWRSNGCAPLAGAAAVALAGALPLRAEPGGWDEFVARCLTPYEAQFPPIVEGLDPVGSAGKAPVYRLAEGSRLVVELEPDDGFTACHLLDADGASEAAFDAWIADQVARGRYELIEAGHWESFQWIEPRVAVQKRRTGDGVILRVMETDLES